MARDALRNARAAKQDEFYTQLSDIEKEMRYYRSSFEGKVVFCNCDDPFESNFFKYFAMNFNFLKLKKLICTCYAGSPVSHTEFDDLPLFRKNTSEKMPYMIQINEVSDQNGDGAVDMTDIEILLKNDKNLITILDGDGDFRSEESIMWLKEADIVVTNPPFSLFREYVAQLIEYDKKFIIIGSVNAITYKEFFPLIKNNKVWMGVSIHSGDREFQVPESYPLNASGYRVDGDGKKYIRVKGVRWWTNLDHEKRHEKLILYKKYNSIDYPKYDNYDAINVDKVADIPCDYFADNFTPPPQICTGSVAESWGSQSPSSTNTTQPSLSSSALIDMSKTTRGMVTDSQLAEKRFTQEYSSEERCNGIMGVPITFLDKYNPEQFEIIDINPHFFTLVSQGFQKPKQFTLKRVGKKDPYARLLIKRRANGN